MEAYAGNKSNCPEEVKLPLALFAVERDSKKRLLFDVSSGKIRGVSSSVFPDATCAFENGGWLLMVQHKARYFREQTVFLVHPSSGKRLDLPVFHCREEGYQGFFVFYVGSQGTPLVVARVEIWSIVPTLHIACPGDIYWSVYKHGVEPPHMSRNMRKLLERTRISDVALFGTQVICVELSGQILIFSITEMTWGRMVPCPEWSEKDRHFLVTSHGEVVLVSCPRTMKNAFRFFRLDAKALEWSRLDDRELDDTSWFLSKGQSFRVKERGKRRVYAFSGPQQCSDSMDSCKQCSNSTAVISTTCFTGRLGQSITNVYAYDLDDGTVEMVIPASLVTEVCHWVQPSIFATPTK
ncbi:unnamed protein product [Urochloa humidicola]